MEKVRLGDIFEYMPKSKIKAGEGKKEGKYKFFTSSNIQDKYIDEFIYDGEYLIFGTGGKASINYCNEKFSTSTDNFVVKVRKDINTKFVYLYFKNDMQKLEKGFKGASIKHISKDYINQLMIPIYDFKVQNKIVNELNKIQEIIDLRREQIEKLDKFIKSQFIEMFQNIKEYKKLKEYSTLITKGASPKWQGVDYKSTGTLFVTSENVREGYIDISKPKYLDNKINEILPRTILKKDDILINIVGASIGRAGKYDYDYLANINQAVALVRTKNINNTFLLQYLNSQQAIKMYNDMKKGGARENLSLKNISDLKIPNVPIELQNQFAEVVKQINKQKFMLEKSLKEIDELQECLMNKYFGGNI